jgi:hypothetical protein
VLSVPAPTVQLSPLAKPHFGGSVVQPLHESIQPEYAEQAWFTVVDVTEFTLAQRMRP